MRMDHCHDLRPVLVDGQMHEDLRGRIPVAGELLAGHVGGHHHVWGHEPLGDPSRCRQEPLAFKPDADVPVVGRDVASLVQTTADLHDGGAESFLVLHPCGHGIELGA